MIGMMDRKICEHFMVRSETETSVSQSMEEPDVKLDWITIVCR